MAITIISAPETTIEYKLGYHHGITQAKAVPADVYLMHPENYYQGYADGYKASGARP